MMKIRINYTKSYKLLKARKCNICNKLFIAYSNGRKICSIKCQKLYNRYFQYNKLQRIKNNPIAIYKHRKSVIEQRESTRKNMIWKDLPFIKKALAKGDEYLVDYIFNHYARLHSKRTYMKTK